MNLLKKYFYKIINKEKDFINSNTIFNDIEDNDLFMINKLSTIDTMSKISVGFLINQICKNLNKRFSAVDKLFLEISRQCFE